MARRGLTGQLNMFDFFNSLDAGESGEVEMVSLVPDFDEEPEEVAVAHDMTSKSQEKVAMSRTYELDGKRIEIAYINYNKVRITRGKETPEIKEFASSKEAVDYYVEQMQEYEIDE